MNGKKSFNPVPSKQVQDVMFFSVTKQQSQTTQF